VELKFTEFKPRVGVEPEVEAHIKRNAWEGWRVQHFSTTCITGTEAAARPQMVYSFIWERD
jgi:hypothetical protein